MWLTFADSYFGLVLQVASTMVIARILTPEEIGSSGTGDSEATLLAEGLGD